MNGEAPVTRMEVMHGPNSTSSHSPRLISHCSCWMSNMLTRRPNLNPSYFPTPQEDYLASWQVDQIEFFFFFTLEEATTELEWNQHSYHEFCLSCLQGLPSHTLQELTQCLIHWYRIPWTFWWLQDQIIHWYSHLLCHLEVADLGQWNGLMGNS